MIVQTSHKIAAVIVMLFMLHTRSTFAAPVTPVATTSVKPELAVVNKPPTIETQYANLIKMSKTQSSRLDQLETANRNALTRNQTLQLENDNLSVQVKALQSDRSAQMFIYGAVAILVGAIIGYILAGQFFRRTRRW
jgi:hypothetical protein